ncbi:MAG: hypothetical protein IKM27_07650 [Clostridia bacterium]|nr:hypothetical protein [Clostridia bacterium]
MFKWLLFKCLLRKGKPQKNNEPRDKFEDGIKSAFAPLFEEYGFCFAKTDLGNAVDRNGKFFFYGPLNAYFIYNDDVCINMLYLMQRREWSVYFTEQYKEDQLYIINGTAVPEYLYAHNYEGDFRPFAAVIRSEIASVGSIFGYKNKKA